MSRQTEVTQVELIEIANAILQSCYREVEQGHWANGIHHAERHCVHCSYRRCKTALCAGRSFQWDHNDNCIVLRAKKIIDESLPTNVKGGR